MGPVTLRRKWGQPDQRQKGQPLGVEEPGDLGPKSQKATPAYHQASLSLPKARTFCDGKSESLTLPHGCFILSPFSKLGSNCETHPPPSSLPASLCLGSVRLLNSPTSRGLVAGGHMGFLANTLRVVSGRPWELPGWLPGSTGVMVSDLRSLLSLLPPCWP